MDGGTAYTAIRGRLDEADRVVGEWADDERSRAQHVAGAAEDLQTERRTPTTTTLAREA